MLRRRTSFVALGWLALPGTSLPGTSQDVPLRDRSAEQLGLSRSVTMADLRWLRAYWEREIDRGTRYSDVCRVHYAQVNAEIARRITHGRFVGLVEAMTRA